MIPDPISPPTHDACPFCGGSLVTEVVRETINYATPKGPVELVADVPYGSCTACEYRGYGEAGERARTEAIYRYHQRLTPWEIIIIREQIGMTQRLFADFIGVGHASIERWEAGVSMQSQSMDNLILLLSHPSNKVWLERERKSRQRQSLKAQPLVSLDRFRCLGERESESLLDSARKFRLRR